ncbi:MAG: DUF3604 domain-containing protein [Myxococcota bacterium]
MPTQTTGRAAAALLVLLALACSPAAEDARDAEGPPSEEARAPEVRELGPSGRPYSEERAACRDRDPLKRAFWGELHVHSSLSMDAYLWDVRNGPDETYRFARGETTRFPPLDESGRPTREARLERSLDFAALTDHASFQVEVALCTRPGSPVFDSEGCRVYRAEVEVPDSPFGSIGARMGSLSRALDPAATSIARSVELCGEDGARCRESMRRVWEEQQAAAERFYDRSAECRFTTFHGYEYTATPGLAKIHHNVIFRNAQVPAAPIAWVDVPDVYDLWAALRDQCLKAGTGCDVLTIPHNSNLSNGHMFAVTGKDLPLEAQRARALLRAEIETLAEISQIKGDSECRNGMYQVIGAPDEFCDYEEWRKPGTEDCEEGTGYGALSDRGCVSRTDYLRYALLAGLREQRRIGVNPYKLGFIAATDAHNANPGDVEEYSYQGWTGVRDASIQQRLDPRESPLTVTNPLFASPGGLAGVWAEENSRDAIFDGLQRRESFGTSGPRITARFFGGWDLPEGLCGSPDLVRQGYARGVPMGGDLPARPAGAGAPRFVVSALRDPGTEAHPGGLLQRAQIVKGWVDQEGRFHQAVHEVAGGANGATVDLASCAPQGPGHDALCAVWSDPDFDPTTSAVYYLRVLENPSCRWNQLQCLQLPEADRPKSCTAPPVPKTIQERLWTSPIWYEAPASS